MLSWAVYKNFLHIIINIGGMCFLNDCQGHFNLRFSEFWFSVSISQLSVWSYQCILNINLLPNAELGKIFFNFVNYLFS